MAAATEALYGSPKIYSQPEPPAPDDLSTRRAFAALLRYTDSWTTKSEAAQLYTELREIIPNDADFHYFCILSADRMIIPTRHSAQAFVRAHVTGLGDTILDPK